MTTHDVRTATTAAASATSLAPDAASVPQPRTAETIELTASPQPAAASDPPPGEAGAQASKRSLRRISLLAIPVLLLLIVTVGGGYVLTRPSAQELYLQQLRSADLGGQFPSDASAIAAGEAFCRTLSGGATPQGMAVDQVAVNHLCPQFSPGFKVLETATIKGSFTLIDTSRYSSGISASGSSCTGTGGYSDIGAGTNVVVKDGSGTTLTTTALGTGSGSSRLCTFSFDFAITEGADDYVVSVGRRGEMHFEFAELRENGVELTLGD